jgi:toxin ParE1/3/4
MAVQIIWSPSARLDLHDLKEYISLDSPEIAKQFVASLFEAVERLEVFPKSGRVVPEFDDQQLREIIRKPCRISIS